MERFEDGKSGIVLIWKIDNFFYLPKEGNYLLESPEFFFEKFPEISWHMEFKKEINHKLELKLKKSAESKSPIHFYFNLKFFNEDEQCLCVVPQEKVFAPEDLEHSIHSIEGRDQIVELLELDNIIIHCHMWTSDSSSDEKTEKTYLLTSRSLIEVNNIKTKFSRYELNNLEPNQVSTYVIPKTYTATIPLGIELRVIKENNLVTELLFHVVQVEPCSVLYKAYLELTVQSTDNNYDVTKKDSFSFPSHDDPWIFPGFHADNVCQYFTDIIVKVNLYISTGTFFSFIEGCVTKPFSTEPPLEGASSRPLPQSQTF